MPTIIFKAVLGISSPTNYKAVLKLSKTSTAAISLNSTVYPNPDPTIVAIRAQEAILEGYIDEVNNGDHSKIPARNQASIMLYHLLQQLLVYVNHIGNGDPAVLRLSGFPVTEVHAPRPVPKQVVIDRIVDGVQPRTAKIYIENMGQKQLIYKVEMTTTPDIEASWKNVLSVGSSRALVIPNMIHGQEVWIRINASNAQGCGQWSVYVSFISQK